MFEKVLVPLDGSELAEAVLPYVEDLGKRYAAEIILLQVVSPPRDRATADYRSLKLDEPMAPMPELVEDMTIVQHPIYREQEMASLKAGAEQSLVRAGVPEQSGVKDPCGSPVRTTGGKDRRVCREREGRLDRHGNPWAQRLRPLGLWQRGRENPACCSDPHPADQAFKCE